jgi:amidophosphoribosyltransferase
MWIALVRLLKPLEFYKEKYGSAFYGIQNVSPYGKAAQSWTRWCWILSIKLDMEPGELK